MANKALRILIADEQHFQSLTIERLFNRLDYYRVAPVHCTTDLLSLVEYGGEPIDVVVVNAALANHSFNLFDFFIDNRQVRHALIYDHQSVQGLPLRYRPQSQVRISPAPLPDLASIQQLMSHIECRQPLVATVISNR